MSWTEPFRGFIRTFQFSLHQWIRSPGFTFASVLTLALGIGATTAIASIIKGVLLLPLPYREPERLVQLVSVYQGNSNSTVSGLNFLDWRQQSHAVIEDAALLNTGSLTLTDSGDPERLDITRVSFNLFTLLGVRPLVGRVFTQADGQPGAQGTVVLSEDLWRRRFGGDPNMVGRPIRLSGRLYTVAGVVASGNGFPLSGTALWALLPLSGSVTDPANRGAFNFQAIGRLSPHVTMADAQARTRTIGQRLAKEYPESDGGWEMRLEPLSESIVGDVRKPLLLLLGAVACVLLIACANVTNLLLARASGRAAEMSIRSALGASRARIVAQLVTESILLAALGGMLGLLLAFWLLRALIRLAPERIPRLDRVHLDFPALLFAAGLIILTGLFFGLLPALEASRTDLSSSLRMGARTSQGLPGNRYLRSSLVVAEVALAMVLLSGGGLLVRSFLKVTSVDLGFRPAQVYTFRLALPGSKYSDPSQLRNFTAELMRRVGQLPGTGSAAAVFGLPFGNVRASVGFNIEGAPAWSPGQTEVLLARIVTPDYFRTLGVPVVQGRSFTANDRKDSVKVAIVNQAMVRRYFPGKAAIGRRIHLGWGPVEGEKLEGEIVGVVADTKQYEVEQDSEPEIFFPYDQAPTDSLSVVFRSSAEPSVLAPASRQQLREIDPSLPLIEFQAMDDLIASSEARQRFYTTLLAAFALAALALGAVGIYGVISYTAAQRRKEVAIRMALGATREQATGLVVRQGVTLVLVGVALGLVGSVTVNRSLASLLFKVDSGDPLTLAAVTLSLFLVGALASYLPGRRVSRLDLQTILREE